MFKSPLMENIPIVICGGGITGLTFAAELIRQKKTSADQIAVIEKTPYLGDQSTGRNSGVLHAGIYYPANSLKQRFCIEGNKIWKNDYQRFFNLKINPCGKFIIASTQEEIPILNELFNFVQAKGVSGVSWSTQEQIEKIIPYVNHKKSFFSQNSAILDISGAIENIKGFLQKKGVMFALTTYITKIQVKRENQKFILQTRDYDISSDYIFNCAGLGAVDLREKFGLTDVSNYFVKGCYLKYTDPFFSQNLLYPLPRKDSLGLGVHTSFDLDRTVRFGPNSLPISSNTPLNYQINESEIQEMYPQISKTFHSINRESLHPDYAGIRPKIKFQDKIYTDFWIKKPLGDQVGYIECLGIESPGLTAAPAIARYLCSLVS